jgi:hypothetical protein
MNAHERSCIDVNGWSIWDPACQRFCDEPNICFSYVNLNRPMSIPRMLSRGLLCVLWHGTLGSSVQHTFQALPPADADSQKMRSFARSQCRCSGPTRRPPAASTS